MKKTSLTKKIIICSIFLSTLSQSQEYTFKQLASMVSSDLNTSVYLDKNIEDYKVEMNIADHQKKGEITSFFTTVLFDNDMYLKFNNNPKYYTVSEKEPRRKVLPPQPVPSLVDKKYYYTYKIKNITNKDVVKTMSIFPKSQFVYLEQSDIISYSCTEEIHSQIHMMLTEADNKSSSALIKITLFSTKKDKMKSYGSDIRKLSLSLDSAYNSVFDNLLNSQSPSQLLLSNSLNIGFTLFALQGQGLINIYQEPTIRIINGKESLVKSGLRIGYKESTVSFHENSQTTTDQIKYRDVGIQIKIFPKIKDDFIFLDLDLISEELLSLDNNIPLTQKISYKSSVTVKKGIPLLLTGIKKTSMKFERDGVPLLESIPLFGELFKKQTRKEEEQNINILIEVL